MDANNNSSKQAGSKMQNTIKGVGGFQVSRAYADALRKNTCNAARIATPTERTAAKLAGKSVCTCGRIGQYGIPCFCGKWNGR